MNRGRLIVFTGSDKIGKTTISGMVAKKLGAKWYHFPNRDSLVTGKAIHEYLTGKSGVSHTEGQRLMLQNMMEVMSTIETQLDSGLDVIADRYVIDTVAFCRMLGIRFVDILPGFTSPIIDKIVLLKRDVRPDQLDHSEVFERDEVIGKLKAIYLSMTDDRWILVDNNGTMEECANEVFNRLKK